MAYASPVIELSREIALLCRLGHTCPARPTGPVRLSDALARIAATARAVLLDRAAKGHEREPADGIGDLLARKHRRVQTLPRLRVTGVQIARVEAHPARPQPASHRSQHPAAQPL